MEWKFVSRLSLVAIPILIASGLLVAASSGRIDKAGVDTDRWGDHDDEDNTKPCSDRTLRGDYGLTLTGEILGPGFQFRGIVLQRYDGKGKLTQLDHVVFNGIPPAEEWTPGSGTYTVNRDCTGSAVVIIPGNALSPINFHFVVVKQGREIHQVVDANAVTAVGNKVD
jgi:hypothetical protein